MPRQKTDVMNEWRKKKKKKYIFRMKKDIITNKVWPKD